MALYFSNIISVALINNQRQNAFTNGNRIATAVENYYEDNNIYPKDLSELIPKYIDNIPKKKTTYDEGEDFVYYVTEGGKSYFLGFEHYYFDGKGWIEKE